MEKYKKQSLIPAFISVLHAYGRPLNFNHHIHMILLDGGISNITNKFVSVDFFSYASFRKRWIKLILDLENLKISFILIILRVFMYMHLNINLNLLLDYCLMYVDIYLALLWLNLVS